MNPFVDMAFLIVFERTIVMVDNLINVAIQVLPRSAMMGTYELVDKAIEEIRKSGLNTAFVLSKR